MMRGRKSLPLAAALLLGALPAVAGVPATGAGPQARNLFIIVMNGVRFNDAVAEKNHLYIDNIWNKLRPLGTVCTKFENRELALPIPSQMSLLTGVWHVFGNPLSETIRPAFPTLFEYWNSARKDSLNSCYFASNNARFEILACSNHAGYGTAYAPVFVSSKEGVLNENAVYEEALPYILEKHPSFVYLSLGCGVGGATEGDKHGDICVLPGEKDACGGATLLNRYYESIIQMDAIVHDLWERIQEVETYRDRTVFLVLSSHGRHTNDYHGYGDRCKGCTQLYLLAIGPGIKKGFVSKRARTLIDIPRTLGTLFAMPTPYAKGNVMTELFD